MSRYFSVPDSNQSERFAGAQFNVVDSDTRFRCIDCDDLNDVIIGGDHASGLSASSFNDTLVGDNQFRAYKARRGNDTIVSGTGNDHMWGDAQLMIGVARGDSIVRWFLNRNRPLV